MEQEESQTKLPGGSPRWSPQQIKEIIGISGVYNCFGLADHLDRRGLYRSLFDRIMSIDGEPQLKLFSPIYCIKVGQASICCASLHPLVTLTLRLFLHRIYSQKSITLAEPDLRSLLAESRVNNVYIRQ